MRVAIDYSRMGAYVISMYLPLTGYKDKTSFEERMSIDSIGPNIDPKIVNPAADAHKPEQQKGEESAAPSKTAAENELSEEKKREAVDGFYSAGSMSTEEFVVLRSQASSNTLEVLDEVIEDMKENMEEAAEAIATLAELAEKTSKDRVGLQVLQKTLDAIDKYKNNE